MFKALSEQNVSAQLRIIDSYNKKDRVKINIKKTGSYRSTKRTKKKTQRDLLN